MRAASGQRSTTEAMVISGVIWIAKWAPSVLGRGLLGLFDEHHRDAIADRISTTTLAADEPIALLGQRTVVRRTDEDLEQLLIDGHTSMLVVHLQCRRRAHGASGVAIDRFEFEQQDVGISRHAHAELV